MSSGLPVLLGARPPQSRDDDDDDDAECGLTTAAIVARSKTSGATLCFDELQKKVQKNDGLDDLVIDVDNLDAEQKEKLVVRATPLSVTLRRSAEILTSMQVSAENAEFNLSFATDHIDYFLSHAWLTSRWRKLVALLYFQNFRPAFAANTLAGACGLLLCIALRRSDVFGQQMTLAQYKIFSATVLLCLPFVAFLLVLLFGVRLPGRRIPSIFLDKVCIHQRNEDLKLLGINSLDLFVRKSRRLLVLYDSFTYQRMWCAYEIAMFARGSGSPRKQDDICFVPICAAELACAIALLQMLGYPVFDLALQQAGTLEEQAPLYWVMRHYGTAGQNPGKFWYLGFAMVLWWMPICYILRRYVIGTADLWKTLANFDMNATMCAMESDRQLVNSKIVETWGSVQNFNEFVRGEALQLIARGCTGTLESLSLARWSPPLICLVSWYALNTTPEHGVDEALWGGAIFVLVLVPLNTFLLVRWVSLFHLWLPSRPFLSSLLASCVMSMNCMVHAYTHLTLWWITNRIVERYELPVCAGVLFLPVLATELSVIYAHFRNEDAMRFHVWSRVDTIHHVGLGVSCLTAAGFMKNMEKVILGSSIGDGLY